MTMELFLPLGVRDRVVVVELFARDQEKGAGGGGDRGVAVGLAGKAGGTGILHETFSPPSLHHSFLTHLLSPSLSLPALNKLSLSPSLIHHPI